MTLLILFLVTITPVIAGLSAANAPSIGTKTGVAIELLPSAEEEAFEKAQDVAEEFSLEVPQYVFLMYEEDGSAWFVFTNMEPTEGEATVDGTIIPPEETGIKAGMIFADSVEIQRDGPKVSLNKFKNNPEDYLYRVIEITGQFRQIALEEEVQDGKVKYQHADGVVAVEFATHSIFQSPAQTARWTAVNLSSDELGADNGIAERVGGFYFGEQVIDLQDTSFWIEARTSVDVVVIPLGNQVGLIVAKTDVDEERTTSVQEVANADEDVQGDVISMEADVVGVTLSTKDVLLKLARCAPDAVIVPGAGCVPLVTDVTVHTGFLIGDSTNRSDVVAYAALSNTPQEQIVQPETGRYRVKGRIVSASQIDPTLPEGQAILVYQMERVDGLTIGGDTLGRAEGWRESLVGSMQKQINMSDDEFQEYKRRLESTPTPSPTPTPTATPTAEATSKPTPTQTHVTEQAGVEVTDELTQTPGQPGFGTIVTAIAILLVAVGLRRVKVRN